MRRDRYDEGIAWLREWYEKDRPSSIFDSTVEDVELSMDGDPEIGYSHYMLLEGDLVLALVKYLITTDVNDRNYGKLMLRIDSHAAKKIHETIDAEWGMV